MPDFFYFAYFIGGILSLVSAPLVFYYLFRIENEMTGLLVFRDFFRTTYDLNEKTLEAIEKLDISLKKRIFESSLRDRDKFMYELKQLEARLNKTNKKGNNAILLDLLEKIENDATKDK